MEQRLKSIEENRAVEGDSTTILRRHALSATPWMDEFLRGVPVSAELAKLIRQAGQNWQVGSLLLLSLMVIVGVASLAALVIPSIVLSVLLGIAVGLSPYVFLLNCAGAPVPAMRCAGARSSRFDGSSSARWSCYARRAGDGWQGDLLNPWRESSASCMRNRIWVSRFATP